VVGEVTGRPRGSRSGRVTVDGAPWDRVGGWDHFAE
jgi:thiamine-monophosphate kinase